MKKQSINKMAIIALIIIGAAAGPPACAETLVILEKPDLDDIEIVGFES